VIAVSTRAATITLWYMLEPPGRNPSSRSMAGRRVDGSSKVSSSPYTGPQSPAVALFGVGSRDDARCPARPLLWSSGISTLTGGRDFRDFTNGISGISQTLPQTDPRSRNGCGNFSALTGTPSNGSRAKNATAAGSVSCPRAPKIIDIPRREIRINPTSQILRRTFGSKIRVLFRTTGRVSLPCENGRSA